MTLADFYFFTIHFSLFTIFLPPIFGEVISNSEWNFTKFLIGRDLREKAVEVPFKMQGCMSIEEKDAEDLYRILHKIMDSAKPSV